MPNAETTDSVHEAKVVNRQIVESFLALLRGADMSLPVAAVEGSIAEYVIPGRRRPRQL